MKKQGSGILFAIAAVLGIWWLVKKQAQATPNIPALPLHKTVSLPLYSPISNI